MVGPMSAALSDGAGCLNRDSRSEKTSELSVLCQQLEEAIASGLIERYAAFLILSKVKGDEPGVNAASVWIDEALSKGYLP